MTLKFSKIQKSKVTNISLSFLQEEEDGLQHQIL